jgi:phosphoribosylaminoimidazole carboxylase PurE protein
MAGPLVGVVIGSESDREVMQVCLGQLEELGIAAELQVLSAHRTPDRARAYAREARERGLRVLIGAAGMAAHLAGALASESLLPVIGVPMDGGPLRGVDALLATVQMPRGVPVATMAIGTAGAHNAALFAAQILALDEPRLLERLQEIRDSWGR